MSYVVASKLKELVKKLGMMSSGDLSDAASKMLEDAVSKAASRAKANGRKTVRPEDL
jgi:histone H3/H4